MRVFLLTQPDSFYIPKLLDSFMKKKPEGAKIVGASVLKGEIAASNVTDYMKLLGVRGTLINGFKFAYYKLFDLIDQVSGLDELYSVRGALRKHQIPEHTPKNINDYSFLRELERQEVDLVISIACPQIVREDLLELPSEGVINIHGALLPKYRGKLPSFWVLANGEEKTGVTVHYMNKELDDGPIIVQKEISIKQKDTLHSLVMRSKVGYGALALAEAVSRISDGKVETTPNDKAEATYFSFPNQEAIRRFRRRRRKII